MRKEMRSKPPPSSSNNAVDGNRRPDRGKTDPVSRVNRIERDRQDGPEPRHVQRETVDGMPSRVPSRNRHVIERRTLRVTDRTYHDNHSTRRETRLTNEFASKDRLSSTKSYFESTVHMQSENDEPRADGKWERRDSYGLSVWSGTSTAVMNVTDLANDSVDDSENASFPPRESSSRAGPDESNPNSSNRNEPRPFSEIVRSADGKPFDTYKNGSKKPNETPTNRRSVEDDRYYSGEHSEERETPSEVFPLLHDVCDSSVSLASQLPSADERVSDDCVRDFMHDFNPKNFDNYNETDSSSSSSSTLPLDTVVMVRTICRQNKLLLGVRRRKTKKPAYNEGPKAVEAAYRRLIFDRTKESLAKHLIEGLYRVSKRYRYDPFGCLGRLLLIQADIRDEDPIQDESTESSLQTPE